MKKFEVVACAVMMTACVSRGKNVKGIITDHFALRDIEQAIRHTAQGKGLKTIIDIA